MLLTVDVGNTQTTLGLFRNSDLLAHWRIATDDRRTADELAVLISGLLAVYRDSPEAVGVVAPTHGVETTTVPTAPAKDIPIEITGISMCSTVPALLHELRDMARRYYPDCRGIVVEPGIKTGLPVRVDNPREVGADRVVNALAAAHLFGGPGIVVDFGTATTFDVISARGEYLGGAIAPGIEISLEALGARGAQLRRIELARPRSVIARNTVEALQSGAIHGFAGQVDGLVDRMAAELGVAVSDLTVVATGGLAPLVLEGCRTVHRYEPWLTLIGLRLVYERNL